MTSASTRKDGVTSTSCGFCLFELQLCLYPLNLTNQLTWSAMPFLAMEAGYFLLHGQQQQRAATDRFNGG